MKTIVSNATIVNEGRSFLGSVVVEDDFISDVIEGEVSDFQGYECAFP